MSTPRRRSWSHADRSMLERINPAHYGVTQMTCMSDPSTGGKDAPMTDDREKVLALLDDVIGRTASDAHVAEMQLSFAHSSETERLLLKKIEAARERARLFGVARAAMERLAYFEGRRFPILGGESIPWAAIAPFESQARANHGQTLERLAERGGLSECEAVCVLECVKWHSERGREIQSMPRREVILRLRELCATSPTAPAPVPRCPKKLAAMDGVTPAYQCELAPGHEGKHEYRHQETSVLHRWPDNRCQAEWPAAPVPENGT
jgi:hypothetical protein